MPTSAKCRSVAIVFFAQVSFLLVSLSQAFAGQDSLYTVGKITIEQHQVFDESDTATIHEIKGIYRPAGELAETAGKIANDLHILTREEVIRRDLLFKEGDPYDQRLIDESARHLRSLGILGNVTITPDTLADHTVDVLVRTHDRWTLNPSMSVAAGGGVSGFGLGLREENFLGSAQKVEIGYSRLSDRTNPNGGNLAFTEPRLFGSWWSTSAILRKSDELSQASIDVQLPFYSDAASLATRGYAGVQRVRFRQYATGGSVLRDDYLDQENELLWLATSHGEQSKLQLGAAYYRLRTSSDSMALRPFDNVDFLIASVNFLGRQYYKGSYIENFGRIEDVPEGYFAGLAVGRNLHFTDAGAVDYFVRLVGQGSWRFGGGFSGNYNLTASSYFTGTTPAEETISATALHFWRYLPNQTFLARVTTTVGSHWSPTSQLTLGSFNGLRGYRTNDFVGQRMLVVNVEDRIFSLARLWFVKLGVAPFFDSGVVWNEGEGFGHERFHSAVGVGLQIESSKETGNGVFRIDLAYNMDQHRIGLVFSLNHVFRAFSNMEFVPPIPGAEQEQQRGGTGGRSGAGMRD
jgi:hypothetical protein